MPYGLIEPTPTDAPACRGLEYAKQLRKVLPSEYDLWYEAPFEDKSGTIKKPLLII